MTMHVTVCSNGNVIVVLGSPAHRRFCQPAEYQSATVSCTALTSEHNSLTVRSSLPTTDADQLPTTALAA